MLYVRENKINCNTAALENIIIQIRHSLRTEYEVLIPLNLTPVQGVLTKLGKILFN